MKLFEKKKDDKTGRRRIYFCGMKVLSYSREREREVTPCFSSSNYWENRYMTNGNSGAGSYGRLAQFKADTLNAFIEKHAISKVIEFGVGDGNQLSLLCEVDSYIGFDVSRTVLDLVNQKFKEDTNKKFLHTDLYKDQTADLVLSLDVIYHLIEDSVYHEYMQNLFSASTQFVIIYASNKDENHCEHVQHRKFTDWIEEYQKDWALLEYIPNKYPFDDVNPNETSFADFYIFEKNK